MKTRQLPLSWSFFDSFPDEEKKIRAIAMAYHWTPDVIDGLSEGEIEFWFTAAEAAMKGAY